MLWRVSVCSSRASSGLSHRYSVLTLNQEISQNFCLRSLAATSCRHARVRTHSNMFLQPETGEGTSKCLLHRISSVSSAQ